MLESVQGIEPSSEAVLRFLMEALTRKLRRAGLPTAEIGEDTDLLGAGVIDSQDLLDVILEAEESCNRVFDPEGLEFGRGITLGRIAAAFIEAP